MTQRQKTLRAHQRFLEGAARLVFDAPIDLGRVEHSVAVALGCRVLRFGYAVQTLAIAGEADEAEPLVRSMLSGTAALLYLAEADTAGRAAAFVLHIEQLRLARDKKNKTLGFEDRGGALAASTDKLTGGLKSQLNERGIQPKKQGKDKRHWTGLTDKDLLKYIGHTAWYDHDYASLSDSAHINVMGLMGDLSTLVNGGAPLAPRYDQPFRLFTLTSGYVVEMLRAVDRVLGLERAKNIERLRKALVVPLLDAFVARHERH
jgi:hypothetical protein